MTIRRNTIGRVPTLAGAWDARYVNPKTGHNGYPQKKRVTHLGSEFESLIEDNTYAPATLNQAGTQITFDTEHWLVISNGTDAYLLQNTVNEKLEEIDDVKDAIEAEQASQRESMATMQNTINAKQLEIGAVQTDPVPTQNSGNHMTSGDIYQTLKDSSKGFVDNVPAPDSDKIAKSGGILNSIIQNGPAFDLSAYNDGEKYADLAEALTALNSLPSAFKRGGMSVKFVQSSDNKYVQYRLMADSFSTTEANWQGVDDEPTAGSDNLVKSGGVFNIQSITTNIGYIDTTNVISYDPFYCYVDYIPISMLRGVTFTLYGTGNVLCLVVYSYTKQVLYSIVGDETSINVNIDELSIDNAYYVRVSSRGTEFKVEGLTIDSTFKIGDIYSDLIGDVFSILNSSIKLDGSFNTDELGYIRSRYIRTEALIGVKYSAKVTVTRYSLAFYDNKGNYIQNSGISRTDDTVYTITESDIPDNASFAVFSGLSASKPWVKLSLSGNSTGSLVVCDTLPQSNSENFVESKGIYNFTKQQKDVLNITSEIPLRSGNYTLSTAIAALSSYPNRGIAWGKEIMFYTSYGRWETYQFLSSDMSEYIFERKWVPTNCIRFVELGFINAAGKESSDSNYRRTGYIPVKLLKGARIRVSNPDPVSWISFYDGSKTFISNKTDTGLHDISFDDENTDSNNVYVRFCGAEVSNSGYCYIYNTNEELVYNYLATQSEEVKRITFSNKLKGYSELTTRIEQFNSEGVKVTNPDDIGASGNVTKISIGNIYQKPTYIKFKFRINENINIARPDLNLSGNDSDLLNIFKFACRYSERIGIAPYAFTQRISYSENGQGVNNPFAKVQGNAIFGSVWNVQERQNICMPDGWTNKLFVGERVFGIRYIGDDVSSLAGNLFIKNDGQILSIHNADNSINYSFTLSSYPDINSLIVAITTNEHFDVSIFGSLDRTPQEMMVFDDICIVNTRSEEDNNDWFYINLANNEQWHTFEWMYDPTKYSRPVAQIDGVGTYINFLNYDIFNASTPAVVYIGGTEEGSNVSMEYKDIDIRIADTLDAEMLINETSGFSIVSKESPRVLVYTMHNVVDDIASNVSDTYTTSLDKLYWVFNLAKKKGYQFISINDLCQFVKGNKLLPSRSIIFINDDIRLYIYLNRTLRAAYSRFGSRLTFALQNNSTTFEYNGITYQVRELVERLRTSHFDVVSHSDHTGSPNTFDEWEIWKANFERSENLLIDDTIHVYVGGEANPFFCDELESNGVKIGLTTTKGIVTRASYDMRIPRYYVDNVESLNAIKSEII